MINFLQLLWSSGEQKLKVLVFGCKFSKILLVCRLHRTCRTHWLEVTTLRGPFFLHNSTLPKYPISSEPPNSSYVPTFEWPCNYRKLCFLNETVRLFRPTTWAFRVNKCVYGVCRLFGCCLSQPEEQLTVSLKSAETRSHNTAWSQGQTRWAHIAHSWV